MRPLLRTLLFVLAAIAVGVTASTSLAGITGTLDPTFAGGGALLTQISSFGALGRAVAIGPGGKIAVAGEAGFGPETFAVAVYNADGTADGGFGIGGTVVSQEGAADSDAAGVAVQPDGKVVVAGTANFPTSVNDFTVVRYNTNGTPDPTFGTAGVAHAPMLGDDRAATMALQPDGKIVVAGTAVGASHDLAVVRLNANGTPDASFAGGNWYSVVSLPTGDETAHAVSVLPDGSIAVGGKQYDGTNDSFVLAKLKPDGALDASFGGGTGVVTTPLKAGDNGIRGLAALPDGKILAAGGANGPTYDEPVLVRYNADGSLDSTFGTGGIVHDPYSSTGDSVAYSVALMPNGKFVTGGLAANTTGQFAVARYLPNGARDITFGNNGLTTTAIGTGTASVQGVALQPDGRVVAAGYADNGVHAEFAVARYNNDSPVPAARVTSPKHSKQRARRFKRFSGTAGPAGFVTKVEIAVRRVDRKQLRKHRCLWLKNSRGGFANVKDNTRKCATPRWLTATGTDAWHYSLHRPHSRRRHGHRRPRAHPPLGKGRYVLYVRVTLTDGTVTTVFSKAAGDYKVFRLK